jgi:hypothetical protein
MLIPTSEANTAGGVVDARCSSAVFRLARVVIPSRFIRAMSEAGCRWVPAFLPVNSHRASARVLAVPNGLATGSAVTSVSRGGMSSSGSGPRAR